MDGAMTITAGTQLDPAIQALLAAMGSNPAAWLHYLIAIIVGVVLAPWGQNIVEGIIAKSPNLFVRLLAPTILGALTTTIMAYVGKSWGITPQDASLALATFLGAVHVFNKTAWAADLGKVEKAVEANSPMLSSVAEEVLSAAGHPEAATLVAALSKVSRPSAPPVPAAEVKHYADGSVATGTNLPDVSPVSGAPVIVPTPIPEAIPAVMPPVVTP